MGCTYANGFFRLMWYGNYVRVALIQLDGINKLASVRDTVENLESGENGLWRIFGNGYII